jgi:hypothetical protein
MTDARSTPSEWQKLAVPSNDNSIPPDPPRTNESGDPPRKENLTQVYNRAADPHKQSEANEPQRESSAQDLQKQIALLTRKLSRPQPTLEFGVKGSVARALHPKRDRVIAKQLAALKLQINETINATRKTEKFELGKPNQLTPKFNQATGLDM